MRTTGTAWLSSSNRASNFYTYNIYKKSSCFKGGVLGLLPFSFPSSLWACCQLSQFATSTTLNPNRSLAFWWRQLLFWGRCFDALKTQWGFIVTENGETDEKKKVCQRINSLMTDSGLPLSAITMVRCRTCYKQQQHAHHQQKKQFILHIFLVY